MSNTLIFVLNLYSPGSNDWGPKQQNIISWKTQVPIFDWFKFNPLKLHGIFQIAVEFLTGRLFGQETQSLEISEEGMLRSRPPSFCGNVPPCILQHSCNSPLEMSLLGNSGLELPHVCGFLWNPVLRPLWDAYCLVYRQLIFLLNIIIIYSSGIRYFQLWCPLPGTCQFTD